MNELEKKATFAEKEVLLDSKTCGFAAELIDLPTIEARIAGHMQGMAFNLLQVGRCLVIARESNLVPHGKWEEWVRFHTGMSERRAQRLMQAVSIAPEGSHIAALPVSKIMALLPLPEEQREHMAAEAIQENLTVKQLQEKVNALTAAQDAADTRHQADMQGLRKSLQNQLNANGRLIEEKDALEREKKALNERLEAARKEEAGGISSEAQAIIDDLRLQLREAEDYAEEQSEKRKALEQAQMDGAIAGADLDGEFAFGADDLVAYTATFLGRCGILAHMGPELSRMDERNRSLIRQQIDYVDAWVKSASAALDSYIIVEG